MTKTETFNTRANKIVDAPCWLLQVNNYGTKKTSFSFYTGSENYAYVKRNIILKYSPEAVVEIIPGVIKFQKV